MRLTTREQEIVTAAAEILAAAKERTRLNRKTVRRIQVSGLMERLKTGTVSFIKLNGDMREMAYESNLEFNGRDLDSKYLTVWDTNLGEYRKVNLTTILEVRSETTVYKVVA